MDNYNITKNDMDEIKNDIIIINNSHDLHDGEGRLRKIEDKE